MSNRLNIIAINYLFNKILDVKSLEHQRKNNLAIFTVEIESLSKRKHASVSLSRPSQFCPLNIFKIKTNSTVPCSIQYINKF